MLDLQSWLLAAFVSVLPLAAGHCECSSWLEEKLPRVRKLLLRGGQDPDLPLGVEECMATLDVPDCFHGMWLLAMACLRHTSASRSPDADLLLALAVRLSENAFRHCAGTLLALNLPVHRAELAFNLRLYNLRPGAFVYRRLPLPSFAARSHSGAEPVDEASTAERLDILARRWAWDTFEWHHGDTDRAWECVGGDFHCMRHGHCYAPELGAALRRDPLAVQSMLELGVCAGNSLGMWAEFFPSATVVGADVANAPLQQGWPEVSLRLGPAAAERVHFVQANYSDVEALDPLSRFGPYDVVVDDGSHNGESMFEAFYLLFLAAGGLKPGGLYVILDVHEALMQDGLANFQSLVWRVNFNGLQHRGFDRLNAHLRLALDPLEVWVESVEFRRNSIMIRKRHADSY